MIVHLSGCHPLPGRLIRNPRQESGGSRAAMPPHGPGNSLTQAALTVYLRLLTAFFPSSTSHPVSTALPLSGIPGAPAIHPAYPPACNTVNLVAESNLTTPVHRAPGSSQHQCPAIPVSQFFVYY
jgi:hypothetical protein